MSNHRLFYILFALILTIPVFMSTIESIIVAIVEGITEYLPISSTGHMIIAEKLLGIDVHEGFTKTFTVAIQPGLSFIMVVSHTRLLRMLSGSLNIASLTVSEPGHIIEPV